MSVSGTHGLPAHGCQPLPRAFFTTSSGRGNSARARRPKRVANPPSSSRISFSPDNVSLPSWPMAVPGGAVTVDVVDSEPTDPVVELSGESGKLSGRHSQQRLALVRGEVNAEHETRARRIPEEDAPETRVREQASKRSFDVLLTHV